MPSNDQPTATAFAPCSFCGHDPKHIVLDPDVWTKIVFAAKDSEDCINAVITECVWVVGVLAWIGLGTFV